MDLGSCVFGFAGGHWMAAPCTLIRPEALLLDADTGLLAGNVFSVYADRLPAFPDQLLRVTALPTATALLRLAPALLAAGHGVPADQALPLYVRDKVALTTDERARVKADKALASG